jgi:hypothetical protein
MKPNPAPPAPARLAPAVGPRSRPRTRSPAFNPFNPLKLTAFRVKQSQGIDRTRLARLDEPGPLDLGRRLDKGDHAILAEAEYVGRNVDTRFERDAKRSVDQDTQA